jgi:REP element-mobilizing transposase RayT
MVPRSGAGGREPALIYFGVPSLRFRLVWWNTRHAWSGKMKRTSEAKFGDPPLAYLLTWTTYGSWLPGDRRGWVAKPGEFRAPDARIRELAAKRMNQESVTLDRNARDLVEQTIKHHCIIRRWQLHAVNCRSNHVHVVVSAPERSPEDVMDQFKAWCSRRLTEQWILDPNKPEAPAKAAPSTTEAPAKAAPSTTEGAAKASAGHRRRKWWTQRGSKRWINTESALEAAIRYVRESQDMDRE